MWPQASARRGAISSKSALCTRCSEHFLADANEVLCHMRSDQGFASLRGIPWLSQLSGGYLIQYCTKEGCILPKLATSCIVLNNATVLELRSIRASIEQICYAKLFLLSLVRLQPKYRPHTIDRCRVFAFLVTQSRRLGRKNFLVRFSMQEISSDFGLACRFSGAFPHTAVPIRCVVETYRKGE